MKGKFIEEVLFIFWIILSIKSLVWIIFNIFNFNLILTDFTFQFFLILSCLSFFVSILSIKKMLADTKNIIIEEKNKQRNVKDVYMYKQLVDPPDADMYN